MISKMLYLSVGVFEYIEITPVMDIDLRIKYTESILQGPAIKNFRQVLVECKDSEKGLYGYQWSIGWTNDVTMKQFWT